MNGEARSLDVEDQRLNGEVQSLNVEALRLNGEAKSLDDEASRFNLKALSLNDEVPRFNVLARSRNGEALRSSDTDLTPNPTKPEPKIFVHYSPVIPLISGNPVTNISLIFLDRFAEDFSGNRVIMRFWDSRGLLKDCKLAGYGLRHPRMDATHLPFIHPDGKAL